VVPRLLSADAANARSAAILRSFDLSRKVGIDGADSKRSCAFRIAHGAHGLHICHPPQYGAIDGVGLLGVVSGRSIWRGAAAILILGAIIVLGLFLAVRPLRFERVASKSARALLRLDDELGATVEPVDPPTARTLGLESSAGGLVVTSVANGGPAADAGIRVGDVVERIGSLSAAQAETATLPSGSIPIAINRGGKRAILRVALAGTARG
jgi:hypothetical protein